MYAYIPFTSDNGKEVIFGVSYNDVMFELESIEIDGSFYDLNMHIESRRLVLYYYMVSKINVWAVIKKAAREQFDGLFIDNNY